MDDSFSYSDDYEEYDPYQDDIEPESEPESIGKYGRLRKKFLLEERRAVYDALIIKGTLNDHLVYHDKRVRSVKALLVAELARRYPPPDRARDRAGWERHMAILDGRAEKIVLSRFVYK
jgi:hypothetical protein